MYYQIRPFLIDVYLPSAIFRTISSRFFDQSIKIFDCRPSYFIIRGCIVFEYYFQEIVCWYEDNIRNFFKPEENAQSLLIIIIAEIRLGYTDFSLGERNKYSQSKEKEFLLL